MRHNSLRHLLISSCLTSVENTGNRINFEKLRLFGKSSYEETVFGEMVDIVLASCHLKGSSNEYSFPVYHNNMRHLLIYNRLTSVGNTANRIDFEK